jgi:hypothetical protein
MKYTWKKEQINNKWYLVCDSHEHVPMIKYNVDDTFTVKDCNGKPRIEKDLKNAKKFALETYKKFNKLNKTFKP